MSFSKTGAGESAARPRVVAPLIATLILLGLGLTLPVSASALRASGGSGWQVQDTSVAGKDASLNSVCFVDATHGWAVGANANGAAILGTTDGGATWIAEDPGYSGSGANLWSVCFIDAAHGWAVGASWDASSVPTPLIFVTTDGGATWSAEDAGHAGSSASLDSVSFVDSTHGLAVGVSYDAFGYSTPVILATTDGGATWTVHDVGNPDGGQLWLTSVTFVDVNHAWAVGGTNGGFVVILATSDGGATWSAKDVDADSHGLASLDSVCFVDAKHGWAVGGEGGDGESCLPIMLATSDGGATWSAEKAPRVDSGAYLLSVTFVDAEHGWAVGDNNQGAAVILATSDGGTTWKSQDAGIPSKLAGHDQRAALSSVAFVDATHGWAVGSSIYMPTGTSAPVIVATTTGGFPASGSTPTVTLKLSGLRRGAMRLGKSLTATGKVTPSSLAGSKVKLTVQKRGARWVTLKGVARTIGSSGAYSWKYKPARRGAYRMRATIAKTAAHTAATTTWRSFKVK